MENGRELMNLTSEMTYKQSSKNEEFITFLGNLIKHLAHKHYQKHQKYSLIDMALKI